MKKQKFHEFYAIYRFVFPFSFLFFSNINSTIVKQQQTNQPNKQQQKNLFQNKFRQKSRTLKEKN